MGRKKKAIEAPAAVEPLERIMIPLNQLELWPGNVREIVDETQVSHMAETIRQFGVIQNLVVLPGEGSCADKYYVSSGGMRLRALKKLAKAKAIPDDYPVPCAIHPANVPEDAYHAERMSLIENVERYAMSPVDEAKAFHREVWDRKQSVGEVAAQFARDEKFVRQRLKLAELNPKLLKLYEQKKLTLETLQAFTLTEDHKRQWEVYEGLAGRFRGHMDADDVRDALQESVIHADDPRVRFIGVDAYRAAGGRIVEDLFSEEGDDHIQILDADVLDRLVSEKLAAKAEEVKQQGWAQVVAAPSIDWRMREGLRAVSPKIVETPEQAARREALEAEHKELAEADMLTAEEEERLQAIEDELDQIEEQVEVEYPDEVKAKGTVFLAIDGAGKVHVSDAYVPMERHQSPASQRSGAAPSKKADKSPYSKALIEELSFHKTAAIAAELYKRPDVALAAVLYGFMTDRAAEDADSRAEAWRLDSAVQARCNPLYYNGSFDNSPAVKTIRSHAQTVLNKRPKKGMEWWPWLLSLSCDEKLELLALYAARGLNATVRQQIGAGESAPHARIANADEIARALNVDVSKWFTPTAENFFNRVPKAVTLAALKETGNLAASDESAKKGDLAREAEERMADARWIPEPMRIGSGTAIAERDEMEYDEPVDAEFEDPEADDDEEG